MEFTAVAEQIHRATSYMQVFGSASEGVDILAHVKKTYRQMARVIHPDLHAGQPAYQPLAAQAFARLGDFYTQAIQAAERGTYGAQTLAVVSTKRGSHQLTRLQTSGDITNVYAAETTLKTGEVVPSVCKFAKHATDTDLLQAEATALRRLREDGTDVKLHPFVPRLLDTFTYRASSAGTLQVNVLEQLEGFYTLEDVKRAYPRGLHPLDVAWMWRRLLYTLGYVHGCDIVHGAVLPQHVMILPRQHGLVLVDWCYASFADDNGVFSPIRAIVSDFREWYPEEVVQKQAPCPATDIIMAARTMVDLMGGNPTTGNYPITSSVPRPVRAFFKGCLQQAVSARPQDAWELLGEFDELLQRLGSPYYPRRFRPFVMP